jgi:ParB family chromosome partitioning protein
MANRRGLGKGLNALIPTQKVEPEITSMGEQEKGELVLHLPLNSIVPNRLQARKDFNEDKLKELSKSIKEHGVVQPIVVRKNEQGKYELVAGERRWRASGLLGLETIPAIVKDYSTKELTQISLIENIQRENLNPMEEAAAYQRLLQEFSMSQEDLAKKLGKSRPFVVNMVRLLLLDPKVQKMVEKGDISVGHARALLGLEGLAQVAAAEQVVEQGLSVRQTEAFVKRLLETKAEEDQQGTTSPAQEEEALAAVLADVEETLRNCLGTQVRIKAGRKPNQGSIEIEYYGQEDLERILELILKGEG